MVIGYLEAINFATIEDCSDEHVNRQHEKKRRSAISLSYTNLSDKKRNTFLMNTTETEIQCTVKDINGKDTVTPMVFDFSDHELETDELNVDAGFYSFYEECKKSIVSNN